VDGWEKFQKQKKIKQKKTGKPREKIKLQKKN
jgi:hypothetical protein